jgi:hypothetical protein
MRDALLAASRDVRNLERFLVEIAEVYRDDRLKDASGRSRCDRKGGGVEAGQIADA